MFQNLGFQGYTLKPLKAFVRSFVKVAKIKPQFIYILILLMSLQLTGCRDPLIHNLSETEANRLLTKLSDAQIQAWKEKQADGKWLIITNKDQSILALKHLEQVRILRQAVGDDLPLPSMMATREERRLHLERVAAKQLERSILSIAGVLEVHVHLNLGESANLFDSKKANAHSSASVVLTAQNVHADLKNEIARLVAGATGIAIESVAVIVTEEASVSAASSAVSDVTKSPLLGLSQQLMMSVGVLLAAVGVALLYLQIKRPSLVK